MKFKNFQCIGGRKNIPFILVYFALMYLYFSHILDKGASGDITVHVEIVLQVLSGTANYPGNFLYYLVVALLGLFSTNMEYLLKSAVLTMVFAKTAKYIISVRILQVSFLSKYNVSNNYLVYLTAASLCIAFSIPNIDFIFGKLVGKTYGSYWLSQMPLNCWHNSTIIFLAPFALLLFWQSYLQIVKPSQGRLWFITFLIIINVLIKPSFFMTFLISYPLFLFYKSYKRDLGWESWKNLLLNLIPLLLGTLLLAAQYIYIYKYNYGSLESEPSGISIIPFKVWAFYTGSVMLIPSAIVTSLLFPLVFIFLNKDVLKKTIIQYALLLTFAGIMISILFCETGPRCFDGNLMWQHYITSYILFLVVCIQFFQEYFVSSNKVNRPLKKNFLLSVYCLHVLAGVAYLVNNIEIFW